MPPPEKTGFYPFMGKSGEFSPLPRGRVRENPDYLSRQLITYIGNKRSLLQMIGKAVARVKRRLGARQLAAFDVFSGSGVVSRYLKAHSYRLVCNDLEDYATTLSRCYLANASEMSLPAVRQAVGELNRDVEGGGDGGGFIEALYAPADEDNIAAGERVFYTKENARRLDSYRCLMDGYPREMRDLLVGPLLGLASVHVNTAGVFKGFYKDHATGIGKYGGNAADGLSRIRRRVVLEAPILSRFECEVQVEQGDANEVARGVRDVDIAYLDPPYNQHPYGSNYFMLNLLDNYERPERISRVSGIPKDWKRSGYNRRTKSLPLFRDLLSALDAKFLLISFNDEGFIPLEEMRGVLQRLGKVVEFNTAYNTFRGCRNLSNRRKHVSEHLFLVERG